MLVNGRFLTRPATGVDRFASELIMALAQRRGRAVEVAVPLSPQHADKLPAQVATLRELGRRQGQVWEQLELPRAAGDQALINLATSGPIIRENQLVVIHDAATFANPGNFSPAFRAWYRVMLAALMKRARVVASVSKFSAGELARYLGSRPRGIEIIGEGGEHILREAPDDSVVRRLQLQDRRFVLAVGNRSPNKNFALVAQALERVTGADVLLVAVGGGNDRVFTGDRVQSDRMLRTGYVSDAQLRALYERAACFVFPSFYEGFGLPPLEAMCCGCPVIVSDRSSLPEVCGDAAWYCRPDDPEGLARQIDRLLESSQARKELQEAGRARTRVYGWDKAAAQFEDILSANGMAP